MTHLLRKQARKTALLVFLFVAGIYTANARPTGSEIVAQAREIVRAQDIAVTGKLRTGANNVPFSLTQSDSVSTYTFSDPAETVSVSLGEEKVKITGQKDTARPIRGTVLTYDDLALRFLYWTSIEDLGVDKIGFLTCWKLRLNAPTRSSPYAFVRLWVDQRSGAFLRAQAFDWDGVLAKQFDVRSTQKIDDRYFLKSMKIQLTKPIPPSTETLTYLEINKPS